MHKKIKIIMISTLLIGVVGCAKNGNTTKGGQTISENEEIVEIVVDKELKSTVDEYEEVYDEYIEFMKTYKESSNPQSLREDYLSMVDREQKALEKMRDIDESSLNGGDFAYYMMAVQRIQEKMKDVY